MKSLILNVGSSSIKYSIFNNNQRILKDEIKKIEISKIKNHEQAINLIIKKIKDHKINIIGHRVVHGLDLRKPSLINKQIIKEIEEASKFAPLHNPYELKVIKICQKKFKQKQFAVFDTEFFKDLPDYVKNYSLPEAITKKYKIQRYGFHGLSHEYLLQQTSKLLKNKKPNIIICHLGNGCSISAIKKGKPIDTSMGFTPLEGPMMGTRSGTIDPGIILYLKDKNLGEILNKKSGFLGVSQISRYIPKLLKSKNKKAKLAIKMFTYQIRKYIGSYQILLNPLDAIIFSAGIGEHESKIRKLILENFPGINLDSSLNNKNKTLISSKSSKIKVFVIQTQEDIIINQKIKR
ncbi:acetate/propionate family kinase [archaeon]|nr:acetate/propionate family kinase [archaeon]